MFCVPTVTSTGTNTAYWIYNVCKCNKQHTAVPLLNRHNAESQCVQDHGSQSSHMLCKFVFALGLMIREGSRYLQISAAALCKAGMCLVFICVIAKFQGYCMLSASD